MNYKTKKLNLIASIASIALILLFFYLDKPSLIDKLNAMNLQEFSLSKNFVVIFAYFLAFLCLVFAAFSKPIIKYPLFILIALSTLFNDVFCDANYGKVLEYADFLVLYQAKANLLDALNFYGLDILKSLCHIGIVLLAFIIAPLSQKMTIKITNGGGGYYKLYNGVCDCSWGVYCQKRWRHQQTSLYQFTVRPFYCL